MKKIFIILFCLLIASPAFAGTSPLFELWRFFKEGFSFKIKKAMRIPNGISHCISNVAEVASTIFKPEKVNEY